MDFKGIHIKSTCRDLQVLSNKVPKPPSRSSSVCHEYYDKWARKQRGELQESDSDVGWGTSSPISPRYIRSRTDLRKTPAPSPASYLGTKPKSRIVIYRAGSCGYPAENETKGVSDPRTLQSALGFDFGSKLPSFKASRHPGSRRTGSNAQGLYSPRKKNKPAATDPQALFRMNTAVLNFTEDIVLRGDKYIFIDQLYKRFKDSKCSVTVEQATLKQKPSKPVERPMGRAQLIDFGEIKQILSLRREKLEKNRMTTLKKSDYTTFSVPVRNA